MEQEFIQSLKIAGLSENEAKVYLTILELGPSAIWDISNKSGVKRPTCYVLLEEMTSKGIAKSANDGKRVVFSVISPKQLALMESRKHNTFISLLPQLEGMASKAATKAKVSYHEGEIGIMEVYNSILELPKGNEILVYGGDKDKTKYDDFIRQYTMIRASKGIKCRAIYVDSREAQQIALRDPLELRKTRFLPARKFDQETEMIIFGDSIAYISHSEREPFATTVENSRLAHEERERFELIWSMAMDD